MSTGVVQVAPWLRAGDAVTNDVLAIDAQLRSRGQAALRVEGGGDPGLVPERDRLDVAAALQVIHVGAWPVVAAAGEPAARVVRFHGGAYVGRLLADSELVLATSARAAERATDVGARRVVVMPPFVPLDEVRRACGTAGAHVACVGPFRTTRRAHRAVLVDHLLRAHVDPSCSVEMIGQVDEDVLRAAVTRIADELRLGNPLTGLIGHPAYVSRIACANAVLLFGDDETFGVAAVEAMAAGVPIVAVGGPTLADTSGDAAIVLAADEPVSVIAEALAAVRTDTALRAALVARGRARVVRYEPSVCAATLHAELDRLGV